MTELNKQSLSEKQKNPKIEQVITDLLDGEMKKNALDFITYLRENKITISISNASQGTWKVCYKGKGLGRIWVHKNRWIACPYAVYTEEFESYMTNENMQNIIWNNLFICHRCQPHICAPQANKSEEAFVGNTKKYFGKEFNNICKHWDAYFRSPDEKTINCLKKMIDFKKQTIIINS